MTREEQIKQEIRRQVARVGDELRGFRVFLFGSRATGTARARSDFDVGVIGPRPLDSRTFFRIGELLDDINTLYRIDWVDMNRASPQFREQAMKQTEVLFE